MVFSLILSQFLISKTIPAIIPAITNTIGLANMNEPNDRNPLPSAVNNGSSFDIPNIKLKSALPIFLRFLQSLPLLIFLLLSLPHFRNFPN